MNVDVISNTVSNREFGRYDDTLKKKSSSRTRIKAFKPKAGSTSVKIQNVDDTALDRTGKVVAGWREVDPSTVLVRGTGYSSWKRIKSAVQVIYTDASRQMSLNRNGVTHSWQVE